MLVKFESKSNRVKGLAFHPKRPWVLSSLHNGTVQLWDYRMGTLLDKFEEHEGPVRGCAFHPTQPLLVTGGDDGKVRVYNYQQRRCLFTLTGHMDYVRTVFFHHEAPWIVSASDDQTIRIWNWQSRSCLAVLTGHSHYVMCAQFHPTEDLLVSASLDQTIRVWDISSLKRKHSSPASSPYGDAPVSPRRSSIDLFSAPEGFVKFVLEGHDRGVNWVQFHPKKPLIVSGSDDRSVKLWRYNDSRAWETDTFRGHFNNISCVMFHPHEELIISNCEDKTLRIWDYTKRGAQPIIHRRESDRFWILAAHPELSLIAAGHDGGFFIFKLAHERPVYTIFEDTVFLVKDRSVLAVDINSDKEIAMLNLEHRPTLPAFLSHSPSDNAMLLSSTGADSDYNLFSVRGSSSGALDSLKKGSGSFAAFVSRNRFLLLDQKENQIHIKALDNTIFRSFPCPESINRILPGISGTCLLVGPEVVQSFDLQQGQVIAEASFSKVKYAVWSSDGSRLALLGKNHLHIVDRRTLTAEFTLRETVNIKSAIWGKNGVLYYTNSHHLKYVLPNGDSGVICTIQSPLYLVKIDNGTVSALDRSCVLYHFKVDTTEVTFKLALLEGDKDKVLKMVENSNLIGQSIISYLRQNGYAEIALGFVTDPATRFELGIECCDLETSFEAAMTINSNDCWNRLIDEAMIIGNFVLAERCLREISDLGRLSFLLMLTGNLSKLPQINEDAYSKGDYNTRIINNLITGDNLSLSEALCECSLPSLAYLSCRGAGLESEAQSILNNDNVDLNLGHSLSASQLSCLEPLVSLQDPWPFTDDPVKTRVELKKTKKEFPSILEDVISETPFMPESTKITVPLDMDTGGWEDAAITLETLEIEDVEVNDFVALDDGVLPQPGPSEAILSASQIPFNHISAGNIEVGMKLLQSQCGIKNFSPLEPFIMKCIQGSSVPYESFNGVTSFINHQIDKEGHKPCRPKPIFTLQSLKDELESAMDLTTAGKFSEALKLFTNVLLSALLTVVDSEDEDISLRSIIISCREYILGLQLEQGRKECLTSDESRALSLACYFATRSLRNDHLILALRSALTLAYKLQCVSLAGRLAKRLIQCDPPEQTCVQARKVAALADKLSLNHVDPIKVDIGDLANPVLLDSRDWAPVESDILECPYCGAVYKGEYADSVCVICNVAAVGMECSGLVCHE